MTQAEYFDRVVRDFHRLPGRDDLHKYGVEAIVEERRFGAWKITQVQFTDGTYYNVGQPDQGPQEADDDAA